MTKLECVCEPDLRAFVLGELPSRVEKLVAAHLAGCPACEASVRQLDKATDPVIRGLRRACGGNSSTSNANGGQTMPPPLSTQPIAPPAGYEYLRELGRGGMGVVYLARQRHPHRLVALKVMLAGAHAGAAGKARFLAEANALARLRHPNIVQIHEVGEMAGLPYLALEYINGGTLAAKLRGVPQPTQDAAELVATLARAVHFAHQEGIVHRDLKPANVLVAGQQLPVSDTDSAPRSALTTDHSSLTTIKIADFGLAKHVGPDLTATGEFLGTPSYMAPEQAAGGEVGVAADVWALGAILYECLTGRPPFRGSNPIETLEQVRTQDVLPPERLRPGLSRDLSTVCLKCLEKDPRRRYDSAQALAEDLDRVLSDRPPLARRSTQLEHAWRWCRRNPMIAALMVALLLALTGGFAAVFWQWQRAEVLATRNGVERDRAVSNYLRARAAVDKLAEVGRDMSNRPGLDRAQQAIYEKVLQYSLDFLSENGNDPAMRQDTAKAWRQVGRLRYHFGKYKSAIEAYREEGQLLDELLTSDPTNPTLREARARNYVFLGHSLRRVPDDVAALPAYQETIRICAGLVAEYPEVDTYAVLLGVGYMNVAGFDMFDAPDKAEAPLRQALEIYHARARKLKADQPFLQNYFIALSDFGLVRSRQGQHAEAESSCRKAIEVCQQMQKNKAPNPDYWYYLARGQRRLADVLQTAGRLADAEQASRDGLEPLRLLVADFPAGYEHRYDSIAANRQLAELQMLQDKLSLAYQTYQVALTMQLCLNLEFPDHPDVKLDIARLNSEIGLAMIAIDRPADAIRQLRSTLDNIPKHLPAINGLARTLALANDPKLRQPAEAVTLAKLAVNESPEVAAYWTTLGAAHYAVGDYPAAIVALDKATELSKGNDADSWLLLTLVRAKMNDLDQARAALARANQCLEQKPTTHALTRKLHSEATAACNPPPKPMSP